MRLTLRTLLAYLDDILEPAQAKEIGQKINESTFASGLVTRIREVMRRRRLSAADPLGSGAGLDSNTVAEYLDNALTPEAVTDVEKICLDSDLHLAEVAACHQILTLVLGEPVEIDPQCRERMYALGPVSDKDTLAEPVRGNGQAGRRSAGAARSSESFAATVPEYLRRKPLWQRVLPYVLVSAVAAAWLALIVFDESIFPRRDSDEAVAVGDTEQTGDADGKGEATPAAPKSDSSATATSGTESESGESRTLPTGAGETATDSEATVAGIDPAPPEDEPGTGLSGADAVTPTTTINGQAGTSTATTAGPAPPDTPTDTTTTDTASAAEASSETSAEPGTAAAEATEASGEAPETTTTDLKALRYASDEGIALMFDEELREWYVMRRQSLLKTGDHLVVPEPFTARLVDPEDRFEVDVVGGSTVELLGETQAGTVGVRTWQCRLILKGLGGSEPGATEDDLAIGIAVGDELWRVELLTGNTACGLEITPNLPSRPGQTSAELGYSSRLYVLDGAVRFADGTQVKVVSRNQQISLGRSERLAAEDASTAFAATPLVELPMWLDPAQSSSAIARREATLFASDFAADEPVSSSIPPLVRSPRPRTAELAIRCLALIPDIPELVEALRMAEHEEARIAAIEGIRRWLPRDPAHSEELLDQLRRTFPADDAQTAHTLLWGYRPEDLSDEQTSMNLVDWLEHDKLAIRELAFYYVQGLTNRRLEYRPNLPPTQRNTLVRRLRANVMRDGALITPAPATSEP